MPSINLFDIIALIWFLSCWIIYAGIADRRGFTSSSLTRATHAYRELWMQRMLERDNRIIDSNLVGHLMGSVSFFASTTIIIIGGLIAVLGATEKAIAITTELPFAVQTSQEVWEFKLLLLVTIFVYAFFKFTWSLRQLNYCSILIGAAPMDTASQEEQHAYVYQAARLNSLAGDHFNRGLRAYYFGLAVLTWFLNPWLFMGITGWVVAVLYRREFASDTFKVLTLPEGSASRASGNRP